MPMPKGDPKTTLLPTVLLPWISRLIFGPALFSETRIPSAISTGTEVTALLMIRTFIVPALLRANAAMPSPSSLLTVLLEIVKLELVTSEVEVPLSD
jgi:hypothetical protein